MLKVLIDLQILKILRTFAVGLQWDLGWGCTKLVGACCKFKMLKMLMRPHISKKSCTFVVQ